jgi:uncharacterized phage infection (PIP) family protein YhgE
MSNNRKGGKVVNDGFGVVNGGVLEVNDGLEEVKKGFSGANGGVLEVNEGLEEVKKGFWDVNGGVLEVNEGLEEVKKGFSGANGGVLEVNDGLEEVKKGFWDVNGGVLEVNDGLEEVKKGFSGTNIRVLKCGKKLPDDRILSLAFPSRGRKMVIPGCFLVRIYGWAYNICILFLTYYLSRKTLFWFVFGEIEKKDLSLRKKLRNENQPTCKNRHLCFKCNCINSVHLLLPQGRYRREISRKWSG